MIQPFRSMQKVVLEKRDANGQLDFSGEQAPTHSMPFDHVYRLYFRANPDGEGTWEALRAWLESKSWRVRAKTW